MRTPKPLLDPATEQALAHVIANPPHALLLTGAAGIGKAAIALWLVQELKVGPQLLELIPEKDKTTIGIEAVRQLEHFVSLKASGNRLVLINDAHTLTPEAQNAMLKTLEEPPQGTMLLLTSSQQEALLPTVRSRVQTIEVVKPSADALAAALPVNDEAQREQIMALSGGLPGLAFALAEGDQSHPLVIAAQTARGLLQTSTFEKLAQVDKLYKNKQATADTLAMLLHMAHAALLTGRTPERWQQVLEATYTAEADIAGGAQPKLALTKLMLSL